MGEINGKQGTITFGRGTPSEKTIPVDAVKFSWGQPPKAHWFTQASELSIVDSTTVGHIEGYHEPESGS